MPIVRNDSLPVLERIEQKRASVKYRLNELVDDLFSYLTSELTEHLAVPPDRVTVLINHQQKLQQEEEQLQDRNLEATSRSAVVVDLSLPSINDQHKEPEQTITEANNITNNNNQDVEEEEAISPIRLPTSNKLPVIVNNYFSKEHNNSFSKTTPTTPTSTASSERPPQGTRASSEPPHPRMAALLQADDQNLFPLPSTSSSTFEASSSGGIFVPTVPDDLLMDDLDDADEHSDSDCDCEQCMGVPICKVDLDEVVKIRRDLKIDDSSDRPTKKARTSATFPSLSSSAATTSSANAYSSPPTSPLSTEAIADLQEDFHLQEMVAVGEQCSATFKTISIKCSRDDCRSMFKNKVERNQHLQTVHGTQPYTCLMQHCSLGFDNVRQYGEHVNSEHKEVTHWPCTKCPKVCTDHRLLCRHIYFYHQEGRFKCRKSKCCFVAPFRIDVRKHSQLHTEMYACQFGCGKSFSHTHHRKRHERIHLRLKPFRCKLCQYCSEARSTVIRHIRIRHFNLPLTLKQQNELNIVDNRNPRDYMEILSELMN